MNTKQVEELTGITRQNIRYYERQNLLEPARDTGNAYRDYSGEDVRRLKLIKMLRMLDMPLKEIARVLDGEVSLKEAIARQQENLLYQQKQLQAAIEVCANIRREKSETIDVDIYLEQMERMEKGGSVFARIVDDYRQVADEERRRQFYFYTEQPVHTAGTFEKALRDYAKERHRKFQMVKAGMYPEFLLDGVPYTAARTFEKDEGTEEPHTRIICNRADDEKGKGEVQGHRRIVSVDINRHRFKSILNASISMLTVVMLVFYLGSLSSTRQQFEELPETIPVRAVVMNAIGTLRSGLLVRQQVLDMVYSSPCIGGIEETAELIGHIPGEDVRQTGERSDEGSLSGSGNGESTLPGEGNGGDTLPREGSGEDALLGEGTDEFQILGVNCPEITEDYTEEEIHWADGWDWERFLEGEPVCIAGNTFLEQQDLEPGDEAMFALEHYQPLPVGTGLERSSLRPEKMEIVGVMDVPEDSAAQAPQIVVPVDRVKQIYKENGKVYFASSLAFTVTDPTELNSLKQDLVRAGLSSVVPELTDSYIGSALRMEDDVFIQAYTGLEKNISLLEAFLPFILLVVLLAGYLVPHLLLQGRRGEYAIMRALGTSKKRCTVLFFTEHMLLAMAGGAVGACLAAIFGAAGVRAAAAVWGLFLLCHALGAAAAMWMFGKMSVAAVLSRRD